VREAAQRPVPAFRRVPGPLWASPAAFTVFVYADLSGYPHQQLDKLPSWNLRIFRQARRKVARVASSAAHGSEKKRQQQQLGGHAAA
jgi:hypothetical protein